MKFKYGISPESLTRWETFERIFAIQAERGPDVGRSVMRFIVDAELDAIERATVASQHRDAVAVRRRK